MAISWEQLDFDELSAVEKEQLMKLLLERLGLNIWGFKLDGERRVLELQANRPLGL